ncbi:MAG: hypothetical protein ACYS26_12250 [Planctomycetota bacterium]|jgi:hypothetical protein
MPFDLRPDVLLALALAALWVLAGLFGVLRLRSARGARLGDRLGQQTGKPLGRVLILGALAAALVTVVLADWEPALQAVVGGLLVVAALLTWLRPSSDERECGTEGVRHSWYVIGFREVAEWRLTGEHLRFRLFGEWTAAPLPENEHPRVRQNLESVAADRESRFSA